MHKPVLSPEVSQACSPPVWTKSTEVDALRQRAEAAEAALADALRSLRLSAASAEQAASDAATAAAAATEATDMVLSVVEEAAKARDDAAAALHALDGAREAARRSAAARADERAEARAEAAEARLSSSKNPLPRSKLTRVCTALGQACIRGVRGGRGECISGN